MQYILDKSDSVQNELTKSWVCVEDDKHLNI